MGQTETETKNQASAQQNKPTPEHERLSAWVGTWKSEGPAYPLAESNQDTPAKTMPMKLTDTWEWLPGNFFLVHRWDGSVGEAAFNGIEILGYDVRAHAYDSHFFDNQATCPSMM